MKRTISILLVFSLMTVMALLLTSCECKHEWEIIPRVEATCVELGNTEYRKCTICGVSVGYQTLWKTNHTYVDETVEKAPTCSTLSGKGDKRRTCSVCKYSYILYGSIPALTEHTSNGVATCTTDEICTICNETLNYALGHSYEGTADGTCIRCDEGVKFILPTMPKTIINTDRYVSTFKIESIKIEKKRTTYELTFIVQSIFHEKGNYYSEYAEIGWKLYDEDGLVVDSGTKLSQGAIQVGEKSKVMITFHVGNADSGYLENGKTYNFELIDRIN